MPMYIHPQEHPTRLVRKMEAVRVQAYQTSERLREAQTPEDALPHLKALAENMLTQASILEVITGHLARMR